MLFEVITERRSVLKSTGQSDFCNGIICGTEHLYSHSQPVPEQVLFRRGFSMFHEYFVQISPVYSHMSCYIGDTDIITVIVLYILSGCFEIFIRKIPAFFRRGILHKGK